jgi:hypothetical protein
MKPDLSLFDTEELLRRRKDKNLSYDIYGCLLKRWSDGVDLQHLTRLLKSRRQSERFYGISCLFDVDYPYDTDLNKAVEKLGNDPFDWARRAFLAFVSSACIYNDSIAQSLTACISDYDLLVRYKAIWWAISTTDERFDDVARLVEAGTKPRISERSRPSELKRGLRTISIARRLREGEPVTRIRETMPEEDDFTFDTLEFFEKQILGYRERRLALH